MSVRADTGSSFHFRPSLRPDAFCIDDSIAEPSSDGSEEFADRHLPQIPLPPHHHAASPQRIRRSPEVHLSQSLHQNAVATEIITESLVRPVDDFYQRPSKKFRAHLVRAGFLLASDQGDSTLTFQDQLLCAKLGEALEAIHAGSLIIDDIQDQSVERRGAPTLHRKFGLPLALNAGNWLYFKAFELIREMTASPGPAGVDPTRELRLYRLCHQVMLDAHVGQAIDLGTKICDLDQQAVTALCLNSLRLKTGALMALALGAGAILAGVTEARLREITTLGEDLGVNLQMHDDLGNVVLAPEHPKRFEDLLLNRPSWIWAAAAENSTKEQYAEFLSAVSDLPDDANLTAWLIENDFLRAARQQAFCFSEAVMAKLENHLAAPQKFPLAFQIINGLLERIQTSYG